MKPLSLLVVSLLAARGANLSAADRPNVVLVTLDTTRADRMGFLGSTRGATPQLDLLAKESVVFERAYAQAPITTVSHATILSGTLPQLHKVNDFGVPLPAALPYLPALLRAEGYRTAAFVGSLILDPRNGLAPGFDRGWDVYDAGFKARRGKESRYDTMERRGGEVVSRALAWLAANAKAGPFLLWVHLYDAHDPYDPPEPWKARFAKAPYDGEIAYVDALLGKLVAGLRAGQQLERTALVVLADHGESLGEHGESTHGVFLYDSTLHVPLLVRLPGAKYPGRRVPARVSLVDVLPTVLEAVGLKPPPAVQGESLLPLVTAVKPGDRASYAETDYPKRAFGWSSLGSWRIEKFLFVKSPRRELYDLGADPTARRNLAEERSSVADRIQEQMEAFRAQTGGSATASAESPLDPALAERLAALGYVIWRRHRHRSAPPGSTPRTASGWPIPFTKPSSRSRAESSPGQRPSLRRSWPPIPRSRWPSSSSAFRGLDSASSRTPSLPCARPSRCNPRTPWPTTRWDSASSRPETGRPPPAISRSWSPACRSSPTPGSPWAPFTPGSTGCRRR